MEERIWPKTRESAWERGEKRRKLFSDLKDWPLAFVVTSAVYKISGDETERYGFAFNFTWSEILWILLVFKEQVIHPLRLHFLYIFVKKCTKNVSAIFKSIASHYKIM